MLAPLSLWGDQGRSLLLRMTRGSLLCAIQAKRGVFDSLCVHRFDPAGAHAEHIGFFHRFSVSGSEGKALHLEEVSMEHLRRRQRSRGAYSTNIGADAE